MTGYVPAVDTADLIAAIRKRNPSHDGPLGAAHWRLVRDAVEGGGGFLAALRDLRVYDYGPDGSRGGSMVTNVEDGSTYLEQFPRETAERFSSRVRATTYDNHVAPVARTYLGQLHHAAPQRETTVDAVQAFWSDPDEGLGDISAWVRAGSDRAQRCGWALALIDRPEGVRPATSPGTVGRWLEPDEVLDWQIDERGRFEWVRLCSDRETRDPVTGEKTEAETITVWTRTHWRRFDLVKRNDQWVLDADSGDQPHTLGRVPVAVLRWLPSSDADDLYAPSMLSGSVAAALELFNVRSELRAIERDCVFPVLCIQTDNPDNYQGSKVATNNGLTYPAGVAAPSFISPDASVTIHYAGRIEELTTRCYEAAYLERPSASAQAPESGVARAYRFRQMSALLATAAREHEAFERDIVAILAAWDGADAAAWQAATTIVYPRRFDPQDAESVADAAMAVIEKADALVPEMAAQARAMIAAALFDRLPPEAATRMRAEMELRAAFERAQFDVKFSAEAATRAAGGTDAHASFAIGDRVRVAVEPHGEGQSTGVIVEIADTPAYGIRFDGMNMVHRWYVGAELAPADDNIHAATQAAVNALPAAAPGDVVSVNAAPMAGETTPPAGA